MESYGAILENARIEKKIDIDTASRETAIDARYLKGLEDEDASVFPGESYMVGFLRNYAEYLDVDSERVTGLYRSKVLQEAPAPEALLKKQRPAFLLPLLVGVSALALAAAIAVVSIFVSRRVALVRGGADSEGGPRVKEFQLSSKPLNERLHKGDKILFPTDNGNIIITVSGAMPSLALDTPVGTLCVDLAEESELDIDGDARSDLIVYVSEISLTDETRGAETRMILKDSLSGEIAAEEAQPSKIDAAPIESASALPAGKKPYVILEDNRAYSFTVNATFRGSCEFRYRIDRRAAEENYFMNGETLTMTSFNALRLWMSNCNAVKFSIVADAKNYELDIGKAGQVLAQDIKWVRDSNNVYRLVVLELD